MNTGRLSNEYRDAARAPSRFAALATGSYVPVGDRGRGL